MQQTRFKNFYELEQAYYDARRELRESQDECLILGTAADEYRQLFYRLWDRTHGTGSNNTPLASLMAELEGLITVFRMKPSEPEGPGQRADGRFWLETPPETANTPQAIQGVPAPAR